MKIFNENLEKDLLSNELLLNEYLAFMFSLIGIIVVFVILVITTLVVKPFIYSFSSIFVFLFILIMSLLAGILAIMLSNKIFSYCYKKSECHNTSSNPTLVKLKNIAKQQDCINLVKLWKYFNPDHSSNSIDLNQNQKDIALLQKLDNDLVYFIENTNNISGTLLNLDDFESYQQIYMKCIAPEEKKQLLDHTKNIIDDRVINQDKHMIQQLILLKNEIEEYDTNTAKYFEFKKWHQDKLDMLKLDKDNVLVKKAYQNTIQKINTNKKED